MILRAWHHVVLVDDSLAFSSHVRPPYFGSGLVQFLWYVTAQFEDPLMLLQLLTLVQLDQPPSTRQDETIKQTIPYKYFNI